MNISMSNPANQRFGFWGSLPLSRKLLLAFGVLFVFALVIAVSSLWGLSRVVAAYEDTLAQGITVRKISDHLTINLLSARRDGEDYLLRWRSQGYDTAYANFATPFLKNVAAMRESLKLLAPFGDEAATVSTGNYTQAQYDADIAALSQNIDAYEQSFLAYVDVTKTRGSDENTGFEGEMRNVAHEIEAKVSGVSGLEPLEITYLSMRRAEKDYIERNDQLYVDEVHTLVSKLRTQVLGMDLLTSTAKAELRTQIDAYLKAFDTIVETDQELVAHDTELADVALALQSSIANIEKLGEQLATDDLATAQTNSTQTYTLSIATVVVVLLLSIFLAITLSRQITRSVTQLTKTAEQIASGDFDMQAEVSSGDEVGTLAQTFNVMTKRLGQTFEDVRRRALAVQTSAEVSRRLSAATDPRQLAVEVVEQIQAAFHYYHAHIYFMDAETGDLIMAGGTGEAGAAMLASGHRIQKGRGLVGRAAETNAAVLVSDVSQAIGWLPNPLLPETKSETAIPISSGKQVLGVLDVQQNVVNGLTQEDVELLQSLAGQVAISLQNARTFEESRAKAELESIVNAIGQKIQRATTLEDTLQIAARELALAVGAPRVEAAVGTPRVEAD